MALSAIREAVSGAHGAWLTRLTVANYRTWPTLRLTLSGEDGPPVVLLGDNGVGKTNLLEAISFLAPGRGLRSAALSEITRIGSSAPWAVHATLMLDGEEVEIGTGLKPGGPDLESDERQGQRRLIRIDAESGVSQTALGARLSLLWLTPQMDRLFSEPAATRRRFLDRIVLALHGEHGQAVAAYERAMRERNKLLAERGAHAEPAWLSALEDRMACQGVAVAAARRQTVTELAARLDAEPDGPFPGAAIGVEGWLEDMLAGMSALEAEDAFRERLRVMRPRDRSVGRALEGPHRSDLTARHRAKDMPASLCSTGEQKALLVGMLLAHAALVASETGRAPLLLLDEITAHLDQGRRAALFERIRAHPGQSFMTGTDPALFAALEGPALRYNVEDGRLRPLSHSQHPAPRVIP